MPDQDTATSHQRVRFGAGLRHEVAREMDALGAKRALVLSTPDQSGAALDLAAGLGARAAGICSRATMHTPVDVTEDVLAHGRSVGADCYVAIGGGSTTGLSKALSYRTRHPQIIIPTTYAGSEATPILGQTENGMKSTLSDPAVLPQVVLYDPELVVTLPRALSATSALNAMAHAIEALYARDRSDETDALALAGLEHFIAALPKVLADPADLPAREATLRGAWACGAVLGRVGMALHHKLCHALGGAFNLPHAPTHAIILPHATAFNEAAVPDQLAPVATMMGTDMAGTALWAFAGSIGAPRALKDLGLGEADLDRAVEIALKNPYWNPREVTPRGLRDLLQNAWVGHAPTYDQRTPHG